MGCGEFGECYLCEQPAGEDGLCIEHSIGPRAEEVALAERQAAARSAETNQWKRIERKLYKQVKKEIEDERQAAG